jgi:hypothetical protein
MRMRRPARPRLRELSPGEGPASAVVEQGGVPAWLEKELALELAVGLPRVSELAPDLAPEHEERARLEC